MVKLSLERLFEEEISKYQYLELLIGAVYDEEKVSTGRLLLQIDVEEDSLHSRPKQ